jgi:hypothetical protein
MEKTLRSLRLNSQRGLLVTEADILPALSIANVRELLRATMPLPQLMPLEAIELVIKHLPHPFS